MDKGFILLQIVIVQTFSKMKLLGCLLAVLVINPISSRSSPDPTEQPEPSIGPDPTDPNKPTDGPDPNEPTAGPYPDPTPYPECVDRAPSVCRLYKDWMCKHQKQYCENTCNVC